MQRTIYIRTEECIHGANVRPYSPYHPDDGHRRAWALVSKSSWYPGQEILPKSGGKDDAAWHKETCERIDRVLRNRDVKTRVEVLRVCASGWPVAWKLTAFFDQPTKKKERIGTWTLRKYKGNTFRRGAVLEKIKASVDCEGDELYGNLPDGDIPDGYEVLPDYGDVWVTPLTDGQPVYRFTYGR